MKSRKGGRDIFKKVLDLSPQRVYTGINTD
jgi:hypothetical protein